MELILLYRQILNLRVTYQFYTFQVFFHNSFWFFIHCKTDNILMQNQIFLIVTN